MRTDEVFTDTYCLRIYVIYLYTPTHTHPSIPHPHPQQAPDQDALNVDKH